MPPRTPGQLAKRSAATTPDNAATRTPTTAKTPTIVKPHRPEDLRFEDEGYELEWDYRFKRQKKNQVSADDGDADGGDDDDDLNATPRPATTSPAPAPTAPTPARTPKATTPARSPAAALAAITSARHRAVTPAKPASVAARLSTAASRAETPGRAAAAASDDEVRTRQLDHAWEQNKSDEILSLSFESQTGGSKTSDNTLASLPQLAHQEYVPLFHSIPVRSAPAIAQLQDLHVRCFPQWRFELHEGYNLLFFAIEMHAHRPSALSTLSRALDCASPAALHGHVAAVAATLDDREDPPFLVVHNIDATGLRADRAQTVLAQLASHANVRVVATADHIHTALQWDYLKLARFNWLPHHVATFAPYHVETAFENTLMVKPGVVTAQSARTELQSLPPNSRECFRILATQCSARATMMREAGRRRRCREQFLVSEEANFRTIVTEFNDHQMVASRLAEGVDMLAIPLPPQAIESVLESMS
ncbi:hypothetical protein AMAG_14982 [Allomyces macrogynus ATCC 38327]|uniref:Origin recognition complex subunit 2 n=1 Tax=Allomyces macrogynus (strain ATCC 38327) TaxID=578462 RepID=A0A0L0T7U7_ALLM3|nr:hypothetical protein AMAG_14982 [Allomyces macrogynus ATCC 38327]|eukprot:KNE70883.1 hypothetical protein AMAG_14982 [Allomyces macrogynus ATCC 38327]